MCQHGLDDVGSATGSAADSDPCDRNPARQTYLFGVELNVLILRHLRLIMETRILEGQEEARNLTRQSDATFSWGMLDECRVLRRGQRGGAFVLVVDEGRLQFTYELRQGRPYFTDVDIK